MVGVFDMTDILHKNSERVEVHKINIVGTTAGVTDHK